MELNKTVNLLYQIQNVYHKLALLQFWQEYPEIESITVDCTVEYNDEGSYSPYFYIQKLTFISQKAALKLRQKLFPNGYSEAQNDKWQEWDEDWQDDEDWKDWDEQLEFTCIPGLTTEENKYTPPENLEVEIAALQQEVKTLFLSQLRGENLYVTMEPTWHYNDEYYYLEGEDKCLVAIYGSAEEAKLASTQRNLATVATTCFSEIWHEDMFDGNNPDECETPEQKLELWEKYVPDYLATVNAVQLK